MPMETLNGSEEALPSILRGVPLGHESGHRVETRLTKVCSMVSSIGQQCSVAQVANKEAPHLATKSTRL